MNFGEIENIDREILDNQLNIYDKQFYVKARNRIMQMEKWILELGEKYEKSLFQIIRPK